MFEIYNLSNQTLTPFQYVEVNCALPILTTMKIFKYYIHMHRPAITQPTNQLQY